MDGLDLSWWLPNQYGPAIQSGPEMDQTINVDKFIWDTWLGDPAVDHVSCLHVMDNVLGVPGPPPKKSRLHLSPFKPSWNCLNQWFSTFSAPDPFLKFPIEPQPSSYQMFQYQFSEEERLIQTMV